MKTRTARNPSASKLRHVFVTLTYVQSLPLPLSSLRSVTQESKRMSGHLLQVKGKYDHLVEVCLNFSNGLDDVACFFERCNPKRLLGRIAAFGSAMYKCRLMMACFRSMIHNQGSAGWPQFISPCATLQMASGNELERPHSHSRVRICTGAAGHSIRHLRVPDCAVRNPLHYGARTMPSLTVQQTLHLMQTCT